MYYQLSAGQKRKLHLALALIGDPDILILDEPTTELDVEAKQALHQEIKKLSQKERPFFFLVMIWLKLNLYVHVSPF